MATRRKADPMADLNALRAINLEEDRSNFVVLDTETTGFGRSAEVLELAIVDGEGDVLWDERYDTVWTPTWEQAQEIHGISPEDVMEKPVLWEDMAEIRQLLKGKTVLIFNRAYDEGIMPDGITTASNKLCVMKAFKQFTGSKKYNLLLASDMAGYIFPEEDRHSAVGDCKATWAVVEWLMKEKESIPDFL